MIDRYTKVVLTVIAVALVTIAGQSLLRVQPASAQVGQVHVYVDGVFPSAFQYAGPIQIRQ